MAILWVITQFSFIAILVDPFQFWFLLPFPPSDSSVHLDTASISSSALRRVLGRQLLVACSFLSRLSNSSFAFFTLQSGPTTLYSIALSSFFPQFLLFYPRLRSGPFIIGYDLPPESSFFPPILFDASFPQRQHQSFVVPTSLSLSAPSVTEGSFLSRFQASSFRLLSTSPSFRALSSCSCLPSAYWHN